MLHGHQALGQDGQGSIGREGEGGQDPFEIDAPVAHAGAVGIAHQIVEAIAVELAAHQRFDRRAAGLPPGQEVGHRVSQAALMRLQPIPQLGMLADQPRRPGLVMQAEHLLAGVTEGGVADVVQQGCRQQQGSVLSEFGVLLFQALQGLSGQMQHPQGMGEAT